MYENIDLRDIFTNEIRAAQTLNLILVFPEELFMLVFSMRMLTFWKRIAESACNRPEGDWQPEMLPVILEYRTRSFIVFGRFPNCVPICFCVRAYPDIKSNITCLSAQVRRGK